MKFIFNISILVFLFFSFEAAATIAIQSVSGVSYTELDAESKITAVYGGIAGDCSAEGYASGAVCNSCLSSAINPPKACNLTSVYSNLSITIGFTSTVNLNNARVRVATDDHMAQAQASEFSGTTYVTGAAGTTLYVSFPWSYLCNTDSHFSSTCRGNASNVSFENGAKKIYVYVDENINGTKDAGEEANVPVKLHYIDAAAYDASQNFCTAAQDTAIGMCGYTLGIGDSKFYLQAIFGAAANGSPAQTAGEPDWYGLAFFPAQLMIDQISNVSVTPQIRPYAANNDTTSNFFIEDNTVTGLVNYQKYCLLMGNVNKAQNIYKFNNKGPLAIDANVCGEPSEVVGLLTDKSCFISTAAFGSNMADQVQLLRKFRDQFLITHSAGRAFVKFYYEVSPPIAHFIEHSEILKLLTRTALYPLIGLAWLAVNCGLGAVGVVIVMAFALMFYFFKKQKVWRNV